MGKSRGRYTVSCFLFCNVFSVKIKWELAVYLEVKKRASGKDNVERK